ncbi:MAG: GreA/GreB family elongation factor [Neobacillus sp.]
MEAVKITSEGIKRIQENIEKLKEELKYIREEKNIAYTLCGDTWHDNPHYNKLEQDERNLNNRIKEIEKTLTTAIQIDMDDRSTDTVQIGSIVKCFCKYPDFTEEEVYEIVGYGESNLDENKLYYESPVAKNIIGLSVGEEVSFETPVGQATYKVLKMFSSWDEV